jgi:hypothetical protein
MKRIVLSPTTIGLFADCPHCFWVHFNEGKRRPAGIFPSLPSGMDKILKEHFDRHRQSRTLPPEMQGKAGGRLFPDLERLEEWRDSYRGLRWRDPESGATLMGAIDDLYETSDRRLAPLDFKTRGYPRKENTHVYYTSQMNLYSLLLEKNGLRPADFAILIFYHPVRVDGSHNVEFRPDLLRVPVDRVRGEALFRKAVRCLQGPRPGKVKGCPWCGW